MQIHASNNSDVNALPTSGIVASVIYSPALFKASDSISTLKILLLASFPPCYPAQLLIKNGVHSTVNLLLYTYTEKTGNKAIQ